MWRGQCSTTASLLCNLDRSHDSLETRSHYQIFFKTAQYATYPYRCILDLVLVPLCLPQPELLVIAAVEFDLLAALNKSLDNRSRYVFIRLSVVLLYQNC